jgi:hypothetical protein
MVEEIKRWNFDVMWALLLALGALAANVAVFATPPLQSALPWVSLCLGILALIVLVRGLWRAFGESQIYRGKVLSVVLGVLTVALAGLMVFAFFLARKLPTSVDAPQVGQQVPDFTLTDSNGKAVSLDSLFAAESSEPQAAAPKAVLLIFYRGYW